MPAFNLSEQEIRLIQRYRRLKRCEQLVVLATVVTLVKRHEPKAVALPPGVIDLNAKRLVSA